MVWLRAARSGDWAEGMKRNRRLPDPDLGSIESIIFPTGAGYS